MPTTLTRKPLSQQEGARTISTYKSRMQSVPLNRLCAAV
jgi:hypothetical protein